MTKFPQLNRLDIKFPDGYLGLQSWIQNRSPLQGSVFTDRFALMPSMDKDTLYIGYAKARFNRAIDSETGDTNYIQKSKLMVRSKDADMLLEDINIDVADDVNLNYQDMFFISDRMPLFKLEDMTKNKIITLAFKMLSTDSYEKQFVNTAYFKLFYQTSTMKGDVNGDGKIDLLDVVALSNHIFMGKDAPYEMAGDLNDDGALDVEDIMLLSDRVLNG